jgi:2-polyprenyl-3-methyl-5-hydroxy-6-metoxy-1,4-benzoquinol methylase
MDRPTATGKSMPPSQYRIDKFGVVPNRYAFLERYVSGKAILDLGCTNTRPTGRIDGPAEGLHAWLSKRATSVLGVDLDPKGVKELVDAGFDVQVGNAEELSIGRQFDCIVAAEIIEHLTNPGMALTAWRSHLKPGGTLLITTCNPFYIKQFWKVLRHNRPQVHGQHTAWFDPITLSCLLDRCGYDVTDGAWIRPRQKWNPILWGSAARPYFCPNFVVAAVGRV